MINLKMSSRLKQPERHTRAEVGQFSTESVKQSEIALVLPNFPL